MLIHNFGVLTQGPRVHTSTPPPPVCTAYTFYVFWVLRMLRFRRAFCFVNLVHWGRCTLRILRMPPPRPPPHLCILRMLVIAYFVILAYSLFCRFSALGMLGVAYFAEIHHPHPPPLRSDHQRFNFNYWRRQHTARCKRCRCRS